MVACRLRAGECVYVRDFIVRRGENRFRRVIV